MAQSFLSALFRRKLPNAETDYVGSATLKPVLGAFDLILMGVGAIIGTGIFVLTGIAAATQAGPAVVLAFVVSGLACTFAALAYAELAASVKGCGSAYGYSYAAFGEVVAWIIGWILVLEYGVAVAAVANGWSGYFTDMLSAVGVVIPEQYVTSRDKGGVGNLPAAGIILLLMGLLIMGVRHSARLNAGMVFIKLSAIAVFIVVALFNVKPELWTPFMPFGWFEKMPDGSTVGVLAAASVVFFAYVGFDAVSTAVEEAHEPHRTVPIGILGSLLICTIIYIIVSGLLTGIVPYGELNVPSPVAHALQVIGVNWASALVATGVITGLTTVMLVLYYALTRIIFAMSRDGLLPPILSRVNEKTSTPVITTVACGIGMALMSGFLPFNRLAELVNIGTLSAFVLVCAGVIVLRLRHPDLPRPFKIPGGILLPLLGVFSCGALITFLPSATHMMFVKWLGLGVLIYFVYSIRHSRLKS